MDPVRRFIRMAGFQQRVESDPAGVHLVPEHGWRYITVHPCSDEREVLDRIHVSPGDCRGVDAYWELRADVAFLQVSVGEEEELSLRRVDNAAWLYQAAAVVKEPHVSHSTLRRVMARLHALGFSCSDDDGLVPAGAIQVSLDGA